ncbi:hypothetical protein [Mesorhizobium sp.]|uniref:hypothetical protein n=1 Tax=Mesorhizobium sp. TaxID=1871066 RepID=UPI000FE55769|nr:hypothetical protein [Mesorhizobium sp.]RWK12537.1 MAG: hypothetical protein EOR39_02760 [Mesorhizobium sp.]
MANRYIGEVPAPEFGGKGIVIRLDMAGLLQLEDQYGEFTWASRLFNGLAMVSPSKIMAVLTVGLRNDKGTLFSEGDEMPAWPADKPLAPLATRCQDALSLFLYGKTFKEWAADVAARREEDEERPPQSDAVL